jgi:hypothetical protein
MANLCRLGILSDVHYAGELERARGDDYELCSIPNPLLRCLIHGYRHYIWLRRPLGKGYLLDRFLERAGDLDLVVAVGDYSCDSAFVGVSDPAARESARHCLDKLRARYGSRLQLTFGDHELGKMSFFGARGGMRLASWQAAVQELGLRPFWEVRWGRYVLMSVVSSLLALPVLEPDTLPEERKEWHRLRADHLREICAAFDRLDPGERVILFCHDPTALPFLGRESSVQARFPQLEATVIGHLHSNLVFWKSRLLAGMPRISFLGHTARRLSSALREAKQWRPFKVRLCPSLAGVELLKDGGYLSADLDPEAKQPVRFVRHRLPR